MSFEKKEKIGKERFGKTELIYLILLVLLLFPIYSYITLSTTHWFIHPDDREIYYMSKNYYETGKLYIEEPLHKNYKFPVVLPEGSTFKDDKILPQRSLGIYLLIAPSFIFGQEAPFLFVSIMGLITVVTFYFLTREVFNKKVAIIATLFFSFSFPMIYWSNWLFSNIPALMFYILGLYFLIKADKENHKFIYYSLSALFFALAIWVRYEYFILLLFISIAYALRLLKTYIEKRKSNLSYLEKMNSKREIRRTIYNLLGATAIFILILLPMLPLNKSLYGSMFSIGYTTGYNFELMQVTKTDEKDVGFFQRIETLIIRFTGQFKNYDSQILFSNIKQFLFFSSPVLVFMGGISILYHLIKRKISWFTAYIVASTLFLIIYFGGGTYWGLDTNWASSSYSRYFIIIFAFLAMYTAKLLVDLMQFLNTSKWLKAAIISLIVSYFIIYSINYSFNAPFGLQDSKKLNNDYYNVDYKARELPENSIIISNFYSKSIISRKVMTPNLFEERKRVWKTLYFAEDMIKYYPIYIIENEHHKSFLNLANVFREKGYKVILVNKNPNIYEVKNA